MDNQRMFDELEPIPKYGSSFTSNALKAINWYANNYDLKVELSTVPSVVFGNKTTGATHSILLSDVVEEYRKWRKEETKRKARERKS